MIVHQSMQNCNFLNVSFTIFSFQVSYADYVWTTHLILNFMLRSIVILLFIEDKTSHFPHKTLGVYNSDHTSYTIVINSA